MSTSVRLRPLRVDDADVMASVLSDPSLYVHTGGNPPTVDELVRRYTTQVRGHSRDGTQHWVNEVVLLGDQPIGYVQATITLESREAEIAWVIGTPWQGQGHAVAATRLLIHALAGRGVRRVVGHIHPSHGASQRVASRLGLVPTDVVQDGEVRWARELVEPAASDSVQHIAAIVGARLSEPSEVDPLPCDASMSGSRVVEVTAAGGSPAMLKVTHHPDEPSPLADREYLFYASLARTLAIPTPEVLVRRRTPQWTAILMRRHLRPDIRRISPRQWTQLATDLALLHQADVPSVARTPLLSWDPPQLDAAHDVSTVRSLWDTAATQRAFGAVADAQQELEERTLAIPTGLIHGDCHADNLLVDPGGRLMLTDWQDLRWGPGTDDLAFLLTRAIASRQLVPRDALLSTYADARGLSLSAVELATTARQLLILALQFPWYAPFVSPEAKASLHREFVRLADA